MHTLFRDTSAVRSVSPDRWDHMIKRFDGDSVYHSYAYHLASARLEGPCARPLLLHSLGANGEMLLPLLLRPLPHGTGWDATSAYGYGGPLSAGAASPDVGQLVDRWATQNHLVATFLRFHPLLENYRETPPEVRLATSTETVVWNTTGDSDLESGMHAHHRRGVRKARKAGISVRFEHEPADLAEFAAMYRLTMERQSARDFYFFEEEYWDHLLSLGSKLFLVHALLDKIKVASLLCFKSDSFVHYHLGASLDNARDISANALLFLEAAEYARVHGLSAFHLGGGLGGGSTTPLFTYKSRFCPQDPRGSFVTGEWVHDERAFARLSAQHGDSTYFPPWRDPGDAHGAVRAGSRS